MEELDYPRNTRIRQYLEENGHTVRVVLRPQRSNKPLEYLALLKEGLKHCRGYDVVLLAEFSNNSFPVSWLIAKLNGALHVVDFFIGKYETIVEDRQTINPRRLSARLLKFLDKAAVHSADLVFVDTQVRADAILARLTGKIPVLNLPVGSPAWATATKARTCAPDEPLRALYYGHYAPLHGVDVLLDGILKAGRNIPLVATFVGEGTLKSELMARVNRLGLSDSIDFFGFEEPAKLAQRIQGSDIVFGIFGFSPKAGSVIANKVWQGLYAGKTVITRSSPALSEIAGIAGEKLIQVEPGNSGAIASALQMAQGNRSLNATETPMAVLLEQYVSAQFDTAFAHPLFSNH